MASSSRYRCRAAQRTAAWTVKSDGREVLPQGPPRCTSGGLSPGNSAVRATFSWFLQRDRREQSVSMATTPPGAQPMLLPQESIWKRWFGVKARRSAGQLQRRLGGVASLVGTERFSLMNTAHQRWGHEMQGLGQGAGWTLDPMQARQRVAAAHPECRGWTQDCCRHHPLRPSPRRKSAQRQG